METFPIEGDLPPIKLNDKGEEIWEDGKPVRYSGWFIFFDELPSALPAVQAASYKILLDRMIGQTKLHRNVRIAAAGNLETDGALVETLSTALRSRLLHFRLHVSHKDWLKWAYENDVAHEITSFLKFDSSKLHTFDPNSTEDTYGCPRTWWFAHKLSKEIGFKHPLRSQMYGACVSHPVAAQFMTFLDFYGEFPTMDEIIAHPDTAKVPENKGALFALSGTLANAVDKKNLKAILQYMDRLDSEMAVVTGREIFKRKPELKRAPEMIEWIAEHSEDFFD